MTTALERITKARAVLILQQPFYGALSLYLKLQEDPTEETYATDGETLFYNPAWDEKLSEKERVGVWAHEVSHNAYNHHTRRGNRDPDRWNRATDYCINRDLLAAGFELPASRLYDPRFFGLGAEEVYAVLEVEDQKKPQQPQSGKPGAGDPQNGPSKADPGGCGRVKDAAGAQEPAKAAQMEREWKTRVAQAIAAYKGAKAGHVPQDLQRMFDQMQKPAPLDWRQMLRRFIDERTRVAYSWARPNKRYLGIGYVIPGIVPDGLNHVGVIVDTSGSIDKKALARFVSELQAAVDDGATAKVTVVCCDTDVKAIHEFTEGEQIVFKPVGGGGTRFWPALSWFAKNAPDVAVLIYFTDLDCDAYGEEPAVPILWLAYGPPDKTLQRAKSVPFGEVVPLID